MEFNREMDFRKHELLEYDIVKCDASHADELLALAKESFIQAFEKSSDPDNFKLYVAQAFTPSVLAEELAHLQTVFFMLRTPENENVGYIKMRWDRGDEFFPHQKSIELQRIYVLEKFWHQGYGKVLLDYAEHYASNATYTWIYLLVWFQNHTAIRFYERNYWKQFAKKDFKFGNEIHHDIVMKKNIGFSSIFGWD
jgi:diamine N-acetyltransferase